MNTPNLYRNVGSLFIVVSANLSTALAFNELWVNIGSPVGLLAIALTVLWILFFVVTVVLLCQYWHRPDYVYVTKDTFDDFLKHIERKSTNTGPR